MIGFREEVKYSLIWIFVVLTEALRGDIWKSKSPKSFSSIFEGFPFKHTGVDTNNVYFFLFSFVLAAQLWGERWIFGENANKGIFSSRAKTSDEQTLLMHTFNIFHLVTKKTSKVAFSILPSIKICPDISPTVVFFLGGKVQTTFCH